MGFMLSSFAYVYVVLYIELQRFEYRNLYCYNYTVTVLRVSVPRVSVPRVSVRSFLPLRTSRPRNIGTYVFTAARKTLYIAIIIVIFA